MLVVTTLREEILAGRKFGGFGDVTIFTIFRQSFF